MLIASPPRCRAYSRRDILRRIAFDSHDKIRWPLMLAERHTPCRLRRRLLPLILRCRGHAPQAFRVIAMMSLCCH